MAAVDYFLRIDGIQGDSANDKHKGEIEVESWSWGETQTGSDGVGGGGGAGKVQISDFQFAARTSKASPQLFEACASGQHLKTALLTAARATGKAEQDFLTFSFSDVIVSSFQISASESAADVAPMDQVALNFSKVQVTFKSQNPDGTPGAATTGGFDLKANQKV